MQNTNHDNIISAEIPKLIADLNKAPENNRFAPGHKFYETSRAFLTNEAENNIYKAVINKQDWTQISTILVHANNIHYNDQLLTTLKKLSNAPIRSLLDALDTENINQNKKDAYLIRAISAQTDKSPAVLQNEMRSAGISAKQQIYYMAAAFCHRNHLTVDTINNTKMHEYKDNNKSELYKIQKIIVDMIIAESKYQDNIKANHQNDSQDYDTDEIIEDLGTTLSTKNYAPNTNNASTIKNNALPSTAASTGKTIQDNDKLRDIKFRLDKPKQFDISEKKADKDSLIDITSEIYEDSARYKGAKIAQLTQQPDDLLQLLFKIDNTPKVIDEVLQGYTNADPMIYVLTILATQDSSVKVLQNSLRDMGCNIEDQKKYMSWLFNAFEQDNGVTESQMHSFMDKAEAAYQYEAEQREKEALSAADAKNADKNQNNKPAAAPAHLSQNKIINKILSLLLKIPFIAAIISPKLQSQLDNQANTKLVQQSTQQLPTKSAIIKKELNAHKTNTKFFM